MYTLEVVSTTGELTGLAPEWAALAAPVGNPLLHPDWARACATAWGGDSTPAVHVLRRDGDLVAVAPLRITATRPSRLTTLWDRTGESSAMLYRDVAALEELCGRLVAGRRTLSLPHLELAAPELRSLRARAARRSVIALDSHDRTGSASFGRDWESFEASLSSSNRAWLRRKWRKLEREGQVGLEVVDPTPAQVAENLARLSEVEAAGWKSRAGTAIAQDSWQQRLLTDYALAAAARGAVRFYFLCCDGRPAAAHLYAVEGGRLWQLKIGYDEQWASSSPGILLMHEVLRHAHATGLAGCEYLGSAESWQQRWPGELRDHARVRVYPATVRGRFDLGRDGAARAWRRLHHAVRTARSR